MSQYQCRQIRSKMSVGYTENNNIVNLRNITVSIGCSCVRRQSQFIENFLSPIRTKKSRVPPAAVAAAALPPPSSAAAALNNNNMDALTSPREQTQQQLRPLRQQQQLAAAYNLPAPPQFGEDRFTL